MKDIHNDAFGVAGVKITKYQKKYKKQYDEQHKVRKFNFKMNSKVQYKKHYSKRAKGAKSKIKYLPYNTYLVIHRIDRTKKNVILKNPQTGTIYKKHYHFDDIRAFKKKSRAKKASVKKSK